MQKCLKVFLKKDGIYFQDFEAKDDLFPLEDLNYDDFRIISILWMRDDSGGIQYIAIVEQS